jgi:hypothetical protein
VEGSIEGETGVRVERIFQIAGSDSNDIRGLWSLSALNDIKFNRFTFLEGLVSLALKGRVVDEDILPVLQFDKTESLSIIEPFYGTPAFHVPPPL